MMLNTGLVISIISVIFVIIRMNENNAKRDASSWL